MIKRPRIGKLNLLGRLGRRISQKPRKISNKMVEQLAEMAAKSPEPKIQDLEKMLQLLSNRRSRQRYEKILHWWDFTGKVVAGSKMVQDMVNRALFPAWRTAPGSVIVPACDVYRLGPSFCPLMSWAIWWVCDGCLHYLVEIMVGKPEAI